MEEITALLKELKNDIKVLSDRVDNVEKNTGGCHDSENTSQQIGNDIETNVNFDSGPQQSAYSTAGIGSNIQKDFDQIKDKYSKISLPQHLRVHDPITGIKTECRPSLKIINKTARFAETALKIISKLCPTVVAYENEEINDLFAVFQAQINFLQSEYSGLVVKSTFDEETSKLFKSLELNSSVFNEKSLNNIRVAAELASISTKHHRGQYRSARGGRSSRGYDRFNNFSRGVTFRGRGASFPSQPINDRE